MANPTCRNRDRSADAGACCGSCAARIMASALNPHFRGWRKKLPLAPCLRIDPLALLVSWDYPAATVLA